MLSAADIRLINPNTRTCLVFRSSADADLTKRIYAYVPALINEAKGAAANPWGISFTTMFHMSNDSALFRTAQELAESGAMGSGANWDMPDGTRMVPLYEAKMVHHFDHRWADVQADTEEHEGSSASRHLPNAFVTPRYWIAKGEIDSRLAHAGWGRSWLMGFRGITNATNERSLIGAAFPRYGVGNSLPIMLPDSADRPEILACLQANMTAIVTDFVARQKIGGLNLKFFIVKQFPILLPTTYTDDIMAYLLPRILALTYTAEDMRPWAEDIGYHGQPFAWDETRRAGLRAEIDAAFARLYGLTRDELRCVLDPSDICGAHFPSETFRVLKEKETRRYGDYRTARLVLAAWDRLEAEGFFATTRHAA